MRQHDKVLTTVRVFSRLKPDQRKALLTEKVCVGWGWVGWGGGAGLLSA